MCLAVNRRGVLFRLPDIEYRQFALLDILRVICLQYIGWTHHKLTCARRPIWAYHLELCPKQ